MICKNKIHSFFIGLSKHLHYYSLPLTQGLSTQEGRLSGVSEPEDRIPVDVSYDPLPTTFTVMVMHAIVWAHLAKVRSVRQSHLEPGAISSLIAGFPVLKLTKDLRVGK